MTFQTALTVDELATIHGDSGAIEYAVTVCTNTVLLYGRINSDLATPTSWTRFDYTALSGDWTDVEPFMVLLMGTENDINKYTSRGRVRPDLSEDQGITASIVFCNQNSADFVDGDYFWIINSYDLTNRLSAASSQDPDTALELLDYNLPGGQLPACIGLQTAYVGDVDIVSGKLRIHIDISASKQTDNRATSSLTQTWIIANATYIVGSNTSNIITVDVDPGEQWATLLLEDSLGQIRRRKFYINAHDISNPPFTDVESIKITGNLNNGWTSTLTAFNGLTDLLPSTFFVVWKRKGIPSTFVRRNVAFVGWSMNQSAMVKGDANGVIESTATINLAGVFSRLSRLESQETPMYDVASPVKNGDIVQLTPQRTHLYYLDWYTTAGVLCDIDLQPFDNDFNFPIIPTTGNIAAEAMNSIAKQWNAVLEFAPWGAMSISRSVVFLDQADRDDLPVICNYTAQDIVLPTGIGRDFDRTINTGKTDANGAIYILSTKNVRDWQTRSPGHAQGEGSGSNILSNQILTASNNELDGLIELRQRGADFYEESNLQDTLTVTHPDTYGFIIPTKTELYTFDLDLLVPSDQGINHIVLDPSMLWTVEEINYTIKQLGSVDVETKYKRVPVKGFPGDDITINPPNSDIPAIVDPGLPAFDFEPLDISIPDIGFDLEDIAPADLVPKEGVIFFDGDELIVWSSTANRAFLVRNYVRLTTPNVIDITPDNLGSYTIVQLVADPDRVGKYGIGCYLLAYDGTNSAVWYNPNIALAGTIGGWVKGNDVVGQYTVIRATGTAGSVEMYCPQSTAASVSVSYLTGTGPSTLTEGSTYTFSSTTSGGHEEISFILSSCANYTVLSTSSWTHCPTPTCAADGLAPGCGSWGGNYTLPALPWAVTNADRFDLNSSTVYSVDIRIDSISSGWSQTLDLTAQDWGFFADYPYPNTFNGGARTAGVGWHGTEPGGGDTRPIGGWSRRISQTYISTIQIHYTCPFNSVGGSRHIDAWKNSIGTIHSSLFSGTVVGGLTLNGGNGTFLDTLTLNDYVDIMNIVIDTNLNVGVANACTNDYLIISGTGNNPFIGNGVVVQYSSDYGGTFGGEIAVGDTPSLNIGGFDTQRSGGVSYAAYSGGVAKATSLGGGYSPWWTSPSGDPTCIIQPYFRRNSSTRNTAVSNPDAVVATTTGKLYWIDGSTATETDISPSGVTVFDDPNCVSTHFGGHIACYGSVSGTFHLFTSTNGGTSWTDRGAVGTPGFIRCRRKDESGAANGTNRGQLYLVRGDGYYSSKWAGSGMFIRNMPVSMTGLETLW